MDFELVNFLAQCNKKTGLVAQPAKKSNGSQAIISWGEVMQASAIKPVSIEKVINKLLFQLPALTTVAVVKAGSWKQSGACELLIRLRRGSSSLAQCGAGAAETSRPERALYARQATDGYSDSLSQAAAPYQGSGLATSPSILGMPAWRWPAKFFNQLFPDQPVIP